MFPKFKPNEIIKRSHLHDLYGGNRQSGITPSSKYPLIFIFTGSGGKQHGYKDSWENKNVFSYTGEGQVGDMTFTKGNLALKDHIKKGKKVFLFKNIKSGIVEFVSELQFIDCDYFETHDRNGKLRIGIKFFFQKVGAHVYDILDKLAIPKFNEAEMSYERLKPNVTERKGLVTSRVGQGAYRKSILHRWEYKCAATGFNNPRILIASHIKPWKNASDEQRLDVDNGILLSPDFDALFDKHLISFDNSGKIILSNQLKMSSYGFLGISGKEKIVNLSEGNQYYLENHRSELSV